MDCPRRRWPRSCSDLQGPASYSRHHGIKGGYTLARDPQQISVLDVIKASEGATRDGIHGKHWRDLESLPGYHQLRMVSQLVEDALHRITIADLKEQASSPTEVTMLGAAEARAAKRR
jgi:DNA-binding IscR family transcriptional regulator